ncbi:hypothetical protein BaRGS_00013372, partial [Batillaria attramentaria]
MKALALVVIILGIIFLVLLDDTPHCTVPSVHKGQNATLTCFFELNVNSTDERHGFIVHFYGDETKAVLRCTWDSDSSLGCDVKTGYYFNNQASNTIDLIILEARENQTGTYGCQIIGRDPGTGNTCNFTLKADKSLAVRTSYQCMF